MKADKNLMDDDIDMARILYHEEVPQLVVQ
jgi:hypothetical protein